MDEQLKNIMEVQRVGFAQRKKVIIIAAVIMVVALLCLGILMVGLGDEETRQLFLGFPVTCVFLMAFFVVRIVYMQKDLKPSIQNLPEEVKARINEDCMKCPAAGNAILCQDGLLVVVDVASVILYSDVIYAFESGRSILLYDRNRKGYEINLRSNPFAGTGSIQILNKNQFCDELAKRAPWAFYGKTWENRQKFITFSQMVYDVDWRRQSMNSDSENFS